MSSEDQTVPAAANPPKEGIVRGFSHFIHNYSVIPLAIGVVIANSLNDLVKALVDNIITPFISLITPGGKLQSLQFDFYGSTFKIGSVINAVISFIIVAFVVYFTAKVVLKNERILEKK